MFDQRGKRHLVLVPLLLALAGCAAHRTPLLVLPRETGVSVADLLARFPLAAGQDRRMDLLGATENVSYHLVQVQPGSGEGPHLHASHDLVVLVLAGTGTQWIAGQPHSLRPGDSALVAAGVPHYFVNTGDQPAAALLVFSPPYDGSDQVFPDPPQPVP